MLLAAVTQTAEEPFRIHDILRAVSGALEVPVVVLLVVFLLAAAALVGRIPLLLGRITGGFQ